MCGHRASLLCRALPKKPVALLPHPEDRVVRFLTGGQEEAGKVAGSTLRGHSMDTDPPTGIVDYQEACEQAARDT